MTRRGFNRIELGCVALIIGVLVLALVPAVLKVRRAADRAKCQSHLKQLALTHHNSAANHGGRLPTAAVPHPTLPPDGRLSWYVSILPYCEQQALHARFDLAAGWDALANRGPAAAPLQWFRCAAVKPVTADCHYVGVAGVGADSPDLPEGDPRAGALGHDRRRPLDQVGFPDGTSNTLLLADDGREPGPWARGGFSTVGGVDPAAGPPNRLHPADRDRGSATPAALADGAVRLFAADTDPAVWAALATAAGGESVPPD